MPQATCHLARATKLVRAYIQHQKQCRNHLAHCITFLRHQASQENISAPEPVSFVLDTLSELSATAPSTESASDTTSSLLGSWSSSESWMSDSETSGSNSEENMLSLLSIGDSGWDSEDGEWDRILNVEADDEESDEEEVARPSPRQWV
jgi:hypothetical protein